MSSEMYEHKVWLYEEDDDRLERLMKRLGYSKSAVVRAALKFYEDALDVTDGALTKVTEQKATDK